MTEQRNEGQRSQDIDRRARSPQQKLYLQQKIEIQDAKIKYLKELTKEHEDEAMVKLTNPPNVRNRGDWISERRKIADRYGLRGKR